MKLQVILIFVASVVSRELDLESFTPSPNSDFDLINYGTVRVTKVKKSHFTLSGDFELKQNIGNEKYVRKVELDCSLWIVETFQFILMFKN